MFVKYPMTVPAEISNTDLILPIGFGIGLGIIFLLASCFGFRWWKNRRDSKKVWSRRTKAWILAKQDKGDGKEVVHNDIRLQDL